MSNDSANDDSTNSHGNGLTTDDLTPGMTITAGDEDFSVVASPHVESNLALRRHTHAGGLGHDLLSVTSDSVQRMFREEEVWPLQTYNAETHVAVPRTTAAIAADEVDWVAHQFEEAYLDDPTREELLETRDRIYDALGDEHERPDDDTEDHE